MEAVNWHTFFFLLFALSTAVFAVAVVVATNIVRMAFYLILSLGSTAGLFFLAGADFVAAMQLLIYVGGTLVLLVFGVMLTAQSPFISMKTYAGEWILAAIVGGSLLAVLLQTAFSIDDWRADPRFEHPLALVAGDGLRDATVVVAAVEPGTEYAGVRVRFEEPTRRQAVPARYEPQNKQLTIYTREGEITAQAVIEALENDAGAAGELFTAFLPADVPPDAPIPAGTRAKTALYGPSGEKTATRLGLGLLGHRVDKLEQEDERLEAGMSGYLLPFEIISVHLLVVLIGAAYLARAKRRREE